jgi:hypothetical protein
MLQSEFEGFHESNSISRPTNNEYKKNNPFDGRFRKEVLSNKFNTLNEDYTDVDAKVLVSDQTLQYQAKQREGVRNQNQNVMSMYDQGRNVGSSVVKHKHCKANVPELPSSPDKVKHIINLIELTSSETQIAKIGILDGARDVWSSELDISKYDISDEIALQGIIFLNEHFTINRIN